MSATKTKKKLFKGERTASTIIICVLLFFFCLAVMLDNNIIITVVSALLAFGAVDEIIKAVGSKSKLLRTVAGAVSIFTVLQVGFAFPIPDGSVLLSFYALILLAMMVFNHKNITFVHTAAAFFASVALPYSFSCFIRLNNIAELNNELIHYDGIYLVGLAISCSWLTDSFAYLVGKRFGKHKMAPEISPKKSVEGAIGGIVCAVVFNMLILLIFDVVGTYFWDQKAFGDGFGKYLALIPITIVLSVVSMVGDLSASVLKRNFGIKDFSQLLPGHGGIMDRFDSLTFVLPTVYGIAKLFIV